VKIAIQWFRRDLRVRDNIAFSEAVRRAQIVVPVFILEDAFRTGPDVGAARVAFLLRSLEALRANLTRLGYPLVVRNGRSEVELPRLCAETRAEAVFCNRRYEPYAQARDNRVFNALNAIGVGFEEFKDAVLWQEREILTGAGKPYTVFTPYARAWRSRKPASSVHTPKRTHASAPLLRTDPLPESPADLGHTLGQTVPPAGEEAARELLSRFLDGRVFSYGARRDFPACEGTSRLSAHLRCGTISIRTIVSALTVAREAASPEQQQGCDVFLNELIWREFYLQILANFPQVMKGSFRPEYDRLRWSEDEAHYTAWTAGQTGYPIVDAAMRCLNATGWMHNRLRMITAMFLTKDLLLNWQWGERYFMRQLVDGDMAANNGGWQWSAGTGTDAAPYFRIFNPVTQGLKFDPKGKFVREWLPELRPLADEFIHEPWRSPAGTKKFKYPERIVLHEQQRSKCLAMYTAARARPTVP
jgi:deoxyribodipyrimidine photo-lyase